MRAPRSPKWIVSKGRHHRAITFRFRLRKAGRVAVTVTQLAPRCGVTRSFRFRGHKGLNKFRFNGRLRGRKLAPGTYRIVVRSLRSGRTILVKRVVVISSGRPTRSQLAALWLRDACSVPLIPITTAFELGTSLGSGVPLFPGDVQGIVEFGRAKGESKNGGVLGVSTGRAPRHQLPASVLGPVATDHGFPPSSSKDWLRLFLFVVLGISLILAIRYTIRDLGR
jgi:hypothetical protein